MELFLPCEEWEIMMSTGTYGWRKNAGDYIMVAADLNKHPRGSIVETSLGQGIVCDTGSFTYTSDTQLDIATSW